MKVEGPSVPRERLNRARAFVAAHSPFWFVFVPLVVIYLATANLTTHSHIDPLTNELTGWHLGMTGSVVMPDHEAATSPEFVGSIAWIDESPRGPIAQYPPGAAALSAPIYRLWGAPLENWYVEGLNRPQYGEILFPLPPTAPGTITAALATAAALAWIAATLPYVGSTHMAAVAAGLLGGLGTTMWATASDALWQHGPASMWIALAIFLAARSRLILCGLAFGAAILTRPHLAIIAAAVGLAMAISRRKVTPAVLVGLGSTAGLLGLMTYNLWAWGVFDVAGGYAGGIVNEFVSLDFVGYLGNVVGALVDPAHGLFIYSPWLLVLIPGLAVAWRRSPDWGRGAAIGGLVYLLVQLKANRFSGGDGFLGYRYPLEALTAAGALLYLSYAGWVSKRPMMRRLFWFAAAASLLPEVLWKARVAPGSR